MSLIALASAKSSPGVTTACLALAAVWPPGRSVRLVEADPDGGTFSARLGLLPEPGLSTLAIASRRSWTDGELAGHLQQLPGGDVGILVAPPAAEQVVRSLELLGDRLPARLRSGGADTLLDVGRLRPGSPAWPLVEASDALLFVARPRLDELQQLPARLRAARATHVRLGVIVVGDRPYPPAEVAAALGVDVIGVLADDPRGAAALNGEPHRHLARSLLLRSARVLADVIAAWLPPPHPTGAPPDPAVRMASAQEVPG